MVNKRLIGIVTGIGLAVAVASVFSLVTAQAQMMQHQDMLDVQQPRTNMWKNSMYSASGMSMVQDVRVSGVTITGDNELSVNLVYAGNGTAPSVTVIAVTNHMAMMGSMTGMMDHGLMGTNSMGMTSGQGMMMGSSPSTMWSDPAMSSWNVTQWRDWHSQMMAQGSWSSGHFALMRPQTGSSVAESGWDSGSAFTVKLDGDGSVFDASDVHVHVFPHLT